ncbi:hypothetical protein [Psychromonas sp. KJ10-2]|uniref:hypothetical protein n=1 Tax=Psychromonas sp. KJ10-2 TaxID=3391822 RepID=UPI0039B3E24D
MFLLFITLFGSYPFVYVSGKVASYIHDRVIPSYVIVIEDGVRKAYGPVSLNSDQIYKDLLKPNFKLFKGNTFEKYGCTFAAIPCDESDLKVKQELNTLEIKTKNHFG